MIADFEDFCTWIFVIVDDIWQQIASLYKRPRPAPLCSDSELITMALIAEARGIDSEREMLAFWRPVPSYSFSKSFQFLGPAYELFCVIDSLPVTVMQFYLAPASPATSQWKVYGARFGKVSLRKEIIFGYKLHLLITLSGLILDFELISANIPDLEAGVGLLQGHRLRVVIGDKRLCIRTRR